MLPLQSTAELSKENFHLIRVFQIFEYDNLLDDVFNVSSSPDNQKVSFASSNGGLRKERR